MSVDYKYWTMSPRMVVSNSQVQLWLGGTLSNLGVVSAIKFCNVCPSISLKPGTVVYADNNANGTLEHSYEVAME